MSLGEFIGPMQEMGMEFKHLGVLAWPETSRNLVLKFSKIQNSPENLETWHGVMTWHQHAVVIFSAELEQASCKPELLSRRLVVPRGNVSPPCAKRHTYTAFSRLIFLRSQIRPNRRTVLNFGIISGSFRLFYTSIEFLGI